MPLTFLKLFHKYIGNTGLAGPTIFSACSTWMEEVFDLADRISVFRNGTFIECIQRDDFDEKASIRMRIGRMPMEERV